MLFIKTLDKLKNLAGTHSLALTLIEDNVFILPFNGLQTPENKSVSHYTQ